jgi:DNA-binding transcriptional LysR family regulator
MDKLRAMEVFVATVDAGSFAAAAEALDLSAVMVGKHIRALETQLGARLLERTTRRHALTEIGAAYLERCRDVLASVHTADGVAESLRAMPQGVLRVTAPVAYGAHRLTPVIGDYIAAYPQVKVDLVLNDRVVDLAEEGFDCGIRSGAAVDERLIARPLALARMFAVASPAWLCHLGTGPCMALHARRPDGACAGARPAHHQQRASAARSRDGRRGGDRAGRCAARPCPGVGAGGSAAARMAVADAPRAHHAIA